MSETDDLPPVITVDWEAVEATIGERVTPAVREVIEHTGGTDPYLLDKWGYADAATPALFNAVKDHARLIHPDREPLDARYAPLWSMRAAISALKTLRGEDLTPAPSSKTATTARNSLDSQTSTTPPALSMSAAMTGMTTSTCD